MIGQKGMCTIALGAVPRLFCAREKLFVGSAPACTKVFCIIHDVNTGISTTDIFRGSCTREKSQGGHHGRESGQHASINKPHAQRTFESSAEIHRDF